MNEEMRKEKRIKKKGGAIFPLFVVLFFLMLAFFSLYGFFVPDRQISENENRVLADKPVMTLSGIVNGSFMEDFEAYLADQFPFRDEAIYMKSFFERLLGKSKENGVYIGKNGFLFENPTAYNQQKMKALAKSVNKFYEKNTEMKTVFALVPNSSFVYSEHLPDGLVLPDQSKQISYFYGKLKKDIITVDAVSALNKAKAESNVFYKTDHHWTTRGAYSVFLEIADKLKLDVNDKSHGFYTVSNNFEGTLKAKSTFTASVDSVEVCVPENSAGDYYIEISGNTEKYSSCFFEDKLEEKNKYEVFLGGNYARLTINTSLLQGRKLVIIKDSYANCLIPMLTPYFSKIVVIDPRYMTESVQKVFQEDDFTDMLYLYNANTLFADTSLADVI